MPKQNRIKSNTGIYYFTDKLHKQLEQLFDYPCTIIEAPMGYGKTTAVREYLKNTNSYVLWHKIYNNSITGFWTSFCKLFGSIDMRCADSLTLLGFPNDNATREEVLGLLKSIVFPSKTVIVLDDYHLIDSTEVNQLIEFLLWNELDDLYFVLTTRYTSFSNLDELILKGYLHHITKECLEFGPNEISSYYKLCGISIKDFEKDELYQKTEGWISALYLLMLNYKEEGNFVITSNITRLIEKTVYIPFSEEIKGFLIAISIFDSFTREQAAYMWEKDNVNKLLNEIVTKNAFINYDEKIKTYSIHKILSEFLKDLFNEKSTDYKYKLYQRAAEWSIRQGDYVSAMQYFYLSKDYDNLLKAFEEDKGHSIFNEQKEVLLKVYREAPEQIKRKHPIALLIFALCLFSFYEMEIFEQVCKEFEAALQDDNNQAVNCKSDLLGEYELLLSFTQFNNIEKMLIHIKNSWNLLKQPAKFIDTKEGWTFGSPSVLYMFHREVGALETEVHNLKEALPMYNELAKGHGKGGEYVMEAEQYFNCGNFNSAEISVFQALDMAYKYNQMDVVICAHFLQARIAVVKSDYSKVHSIFQNLYQDMKNQQWNTLIHTVNLCEAFIQAGLHQIKGIPLWILEGAFDSTRLYFPTKSFLNIVYGRVLLIKGEYLKLLGIADQFLETAAIYPNLLGSIYAHIYIAAANERIYRRDAAMTALKLALDIAVPDNIYMPFVENCDYIKPVIEELPRLYGFDKHISKIIELYTSYHNATVQIAQEFFTQEKPKLTERELDVAKLVADGMSNSEIGKQLYISQNTVKTLLKKIFKKLGINSRTMLKLYFDSEE